MTTHTRKRIVRGMLALAGAIVLFVGVVGFAHTKNGRFLLAYIPGMGACPMGKPATPEAIERGRAKGLAKVAGSTPARARTAFGFELEKSTKAEVLAWAAKNGVTCEDTPVKLAIGCRDVPLSALPGTAAPIDSLYIGVDSAGRVVSLDAIRRKMSFDDAVTLVDDVAADVARRAGGTPQRRGVASGAELSAGRMRRAEAEIRYSDYRILITATNQSEGSPFVRERHQAIDQAIDDAKM